MNTILIVDDDPDIRFTFSQLLSIHNYRVVTLPDGNNILKTLEDNDVDLIILDIMLPGKSGIEVLEELKNNKDFKIIPVIMFTAKDTEESITELVARIKAHIKIKKYEDGLRKINLEKQLEILKRVSVTIEHSFGQPLTVILSYLSILERDIKNYPELYAKFSPILSKIHNSVEEIKEIVEKLKGTTNIEITHYVESIKMLKIDNIKKSRE